MRIRRSHEFGIEEARRRIDEVAADLEQRFSLTTQWQGDNLAISGTGIKGQVTVTDQTVELNLKLGFALAIMEGPIRSAIEQNLDDHLQQS